MNFRFGISAILTIRIGACLGLAVSVTVRADQWYIEPTASLESLYDDNVRLSQINPQQSFGTIARATLQTGRRSERSGTGLSAVLSNRQYLEVSELDRTDGSLGLTTSYQIERNRFGFDANFDYDSTLTSEVDTSGLVQVNKRRSRWLLKPSWNYQLSQRATIDAVLSYEDVAYQDVEQIPLFDYRFVKTALTASYALSERTQVFVRISYDQYEAEQIENRSENIGLETGMSYLLSETTSISAFGGIHHAQVQTPTADGSEQTESSGPMFDLQLKKNFQTGDIKLTAGRALVPSGSGDLLDTTSLSLALGYSLSAHWKLGFDVGGYRNREPNGEGSANDRDYLAISPRLERRLTEAFRIAIGYRYRWQRYETSENEAVSNALWLTMNYAMPREPLGR